jgi:hypothetical protein
MVDALVRAASRTLTRAAGMAQDQLIAAEKAEFKSPAAFTINTRGYRIVPAKPTNKPVAQFIILAQQAKYLRFTFEPESTRTPGDAGTSNSYVWQPTKAGDKTPSGSLPKGYTKSLIALMKTRKRKLTGGGVFFGTIHGGVTGDTGIWLRPPRTPALVRRPLENLPCRHCPDVFGFLACLPEKQVRAVMKTYGMIVDLTAVDCCLHDVLPAEEERATREKVITYLAEKPAADENALAIEGLRYLR